MTARWHEGNGRSAVAAVSCGEVLRQAFWRLRGDAGGGSPKANRGQTIGPDGMPRSAAAGGEEYDPTILL